jgi:hypothetical protein
MAHRGKYFPVHPRRDFNANCDIRNVHAIANKYDITLHSGLVPPTPLDGLTFRLNPMSQPDEATLAWGITDALIAGHLWSIRLRIVFNKLPDSLLQTTFFLFEYEFLATSWRNVPESRDFPLDPGNLLTHETLYIDYSAFPDGCSFFNSVTTPVGYSP